MLHTAFPTQSLNLVLWQCLPLDCALTWGQVLLSPAAWSLTVTQGREKRSLQGIQLFLPGKWELCAPAQSDPPQAELPGQDGTQHTEISEQVSLEP